MFGPLEVRHPEQGDVYVDGQNLRSWLNYLMCYYR